MTQARYAIVPTAALEDDRLTAMDFKVLAVIGSFLGKDLVCWPSQSSIAERAKCSRQSVSSAVSKLAKYGYLEVIQTAPSGMKKALKYRVILDVKISDIDDKNLDNDVKSGPDNDVKPELYNIIEDTQQKIPNYFSEVWAVWSKQGKQRSKAKAKCLDAFKRASAKVGDDALKAACFAYAKKTEDKFHKALDRWLADGRYEAWLPKAQDEQADIRPTSADDWKQAFRDYCDLGVWDRIEYGPAPHEPGCRAPAEYLRGAAKVLSPAHRHHEGVVINFREATAKQGDAA